MKKKSGFTLIELLATLVLLALLSLITVPMLLRYIKKSKEQTLLESARNIVRTVELAHIDSVSQDTQIYKIKDGKISPSLSLSGKIRGEGFIEVDSYQNIRIHLTEENVCAQKHFSDANVYLVEGSCKKEPDQIINLDKSGAAVPLLDTSMVPIRREGNIWVKADQDNCTEAYQWYDYSKGMWANMAVVKTNLKEKYRMLAVGEKIEEEDVLGYFVGIPTFIYRLREGSGERSFDVQFTNQNIEGYTSHPAFRWGDEEITGFWIAKYELSGSTSQVFSLPGKATLKNTSLLSLYKSMETLNSIKKKDEFNSKLAEIHLLKNVEWGAVTILSQSPYGVCPNGKCTNVSKNETWNTGYADRNSPYDSQKGMKASTTGNIYGVYDMNGCAWEFTMGTNKIASLNTNIDPVKYDAYSTVGIKGDLTTEDGTKGWYGSTATFLTNSQNWFVRGGDVNTKDSSLFWYKPDSPNGGFRNGFRIAYALNRIEE